MSIKKINSIAFVTFDLQNGGAEKMLAFVAKSTLKIANEVYVISLYDNNPEIKLDSRIKVIYANNDLDDSKPYKKISDKLKTVMVLLISLRQQIKLLNPSILVAFGVVPLTLLFLANMGLKGIIIGSERRAPEKLPLKYRILSKFTYTFSDGMVFQLDGARKIYNKHVKNTSTVIPNPYITDSEILYDIRKREKTITTAAARFEYEKGIDILINAFYIVSQKHPEYKLLIYGPAKDKNQYRHLIMKLNLENKIIFPGISKNVAGSVINTSVFVLPSRSEGIPNTLIEVMGVGIPTVSCDCSPGGPKFLTANGKRGILVKVDDYEEMSRGIIKIIEDVPFAQMLSERSLEVKNLLNVEKISAQWNEYFLKIFNKKIKVKS